MTGEISRKMVIVFSSQVSSTSAKVYIEELELEEQHETLKNDIKLKHKQALRKGIAILIPFRKWELQDLSPL